MLDVGTIKLKSGYVRRRSTLLADAVLRLKYHNSIADAVADLGKPEEIGKVVSRLQKYLHQPQVTD
jgi:hypothetical protein